MNFLAVKEFFKPVSGDELTAIARQHGGARGEQSVTLEEVAPGVSLEDAERVTAALIAAGMVVQMPQPEVRVAIDKLVPY